MTDPPFGNIEALIGFQLSTRGTRAASGARKYGRGLNDTRGCSNCFWSANVPANGVSAIWWKTMLLKTAFGQAHACLNAFMWHAGGQAQ
jgi:hypothetical protein